MSSSAVWHYMYMIVYVYVLWWGAVQPITNWTKQRHHIIRLLNARYIRICQHGPSFCISKCSCGTFIHMYLYVCARMTIVLNLSLNKAPKIASSESQRLHVASWQSTMCLWPFDLSRNVSIMTAAHMFTAVVSFCNFMLANYFWHTVKSFNPPKFTARFSFMFVFIHDFINSRTVGQMKMALF